MEEQTAQNEDMHVAYYRVSTKKQKLSGLGLEAQQEAVNKYIAADRRRKLAEVSFQDIESGRKDDRPELRKAIELCQKRKAKLLVAKLDRLARSQRLILDLRDSKVPFVIAEHPEITEVVIGILAVIAEDEAKRIRTRIREALAAKRKRGEALGKPPEEWETLRVKGVKESIKTRRRQARERNERLIKTVRTYRKNGETFAAIGEELEKLGHKAPRGGRWYPSQVARILAQ
jgi:DNA invertase Pin-like site-specific DNA recombinase